MSQNLLRPGVPRVMCPHCSTTMRLVSIEPAGQEQKLFESFSCTCGFTCTTQIESESRQSL
ncbi:MAG: hypothetical protein JOZ70_14255 [Pseudolabrys sp.]|nr:hypothetical protein [Pseudolabrys sp.]MBV9956399.1 hypothetical protein [Pseudolabrys sp.]